jgi:hypothetical protein
VADIYSRIYQAISSKLTRKEDIEILALILKRQREGGKEAVKQMISELIKKLEGE